MERRLESVAIELVQCCGGLVGHPAEGADVGDQPHQLVEVGSEQAALAKGDLELVMRGWHTAQ
jgi:hypothetical protein